MAARLNPRHQEMVRNKIKASQLINVLQDHVLNGRELLPTQITAAVALLKKVVPDTTSSSVTVTHSKRVSYAHRIKDPAPALAPPAEETLEHTVQ